ncbi:hypothetical protein B0H19DRAFT_1085430, partial [Mycena capillaripes]
MVHGKEHRSGRVQKAWARISFSRGAWRRICVGAVGERLVGGAGRRRSCIRSLTVTSILLPTKVQGGLNVAPFIERGSRQVLMEQLAPFKAVMDLDGAKAGNVGYARPTLGARVRAGGLPALVSVVLEPRVGEGASAAATDEATGAEG